jgi:hypothetical protein
MTATLGLRHLPERVGVQCRWVVKERRNGLWVPVLERKNLLTDYGLTALSAAFAGGYVAPQYLVIDTNKTTLTATYAIGVNAVVAVARVDLVGDNQIVLSPGTVRQETVTFSSVTASGPNYSYNLSSPTTKAHNSGDYVVRAVKSADTMSTVISEAAYDPTYNPGMRQAVVSTYSPASGQTTYQFYFTGVQANVLFMTLGLADQQALGAGNLHSHVVLGYDHTITAPATSTNDLEVDATLSLTNI